MKVGHWTLFNGSGMNNVARSFVEAERKLGIDSHLCHLSDDKDWSFMEDCDIHVSHTHFPDSMRKRLKKPLKLVWICHGTPEHVFHSAVEAGTTGGYGHGDGFMLFQYWLRNADARVTFWPRHQAILQTMVDKGTDVHLVPLGVEKDFWSSGVSGGKYAGTPSVWSGENCHYIKWPLDLFLMWPWVYRELNGACLHVAYLPQDQHRWFFPLVNSNGASYGAHISKLTFHHDVLRNIFKSVDYFIGLVRYGDFNRLCLEANAAGAKTISYPGNPYSDFWLPEGDQRNTAAELVKVLKGEVEPRIKTGVPDIQETAEAMRKIYESILIGSIHPVLSPNGHQAKEVVTV
jgi:hypothetical protein